MYRCTILVRKGTALFGYQLTKDGKREPKDFYGRPLKEYWFQFTASPTDWELRTLDEVMQISSNLDLEEKQVLISAFNPRLATEAMPFYLNLKPCLLSVEIATFLQSIARTAACSHFYMSQK